MPCQNTWSDNSRDSEIRSLTEKVNFLEAALCALFNEIKKEGISERIINNASKNGEIDLYSIWIDHAEKDEKKLIRALSRYSEHEKSILRRLLNAL
jgi:hypothetical protein